MMPSEWLWARMALYLAVMPEGHRDQHRQNTKTQAKEPNTKGIEKLPNYQTAKIQLKANEKKTTQVAKHGKTDPE